MIKYILKAIREVKKLLETNCYVISILLNEQAKSFRINLLK